MRSGICANPANHSQFHAALPKRLPAPSLHGQKSSLLLKFGSSSSKILNTLEKLAAIESALPAIFENHPANRKLQGEPPAKTVSLLTASSARQSGLYGVISGCVRTADIPGRRASKPFGVSQVADVG